VGIKRVKIQEIYSKATKLEPKFSINKAILIYLKVHKENKYRLECLVILRSYILQRLGNAIIFKTADVSAKKKSSPYIIIIQNIHSRQNVSRMRSSPFGMSWADFLEGLTSDNLLVLVQYFSGNRTNILGIGCMQGCSSQCAQCL